MPDPIKSAAATIEKMERLLAVMPATIPAFYQGVRGCLPKAWEHIPQHDTPKHAALTFCVRASAEDYEALIAYFERAAEVVRG